MNVRWLSLIVAAVLLQGTAFALTLPFSAGPELYAPEDDFTFGEGSDPVIFLWENTGASDYQLQLAVDPEFTVGTDPFSTDGYYSYYLADLIPTDVWEPLTELTIYWRVRESLGMGMYSGWSETRVFHKSDLEAPELRSPKDARFNHESAMPRFEWKPIVGVNHYLMDFSVTEDFESIGTATIDDYYLDMDGIDRTDWDDYVGVIYWRVAALSDSRFPGPWSEVARLSKTIIDPPDPVTPEDHVIFGPRSDRPTLTWSPTDGDGHYTVMFTADADGWVQVMPFEKDTASFSFASDIPVSLSDWWEWPVNFYWSVASYDAQGHPGPFSTPREITKVGYHRICAFGDSITAGEYYPNGYLDLLEYKLRANWSTISTINMAKPGTKSGWGEEAIEGRLRQACPEFVLIMFGSNDAVDPGNCDPPLECNVAGHLLAMSQIAQSRGTIPIISTIIPVNPEGPFAGEQDQVDLYNDSIIAMAQQYGIHLVDLNAMFWDYGGDMTDLYGLEGEDWGHPSYLGYQIMADGFYQALLTYDDN